MLLSQLAMYFVLQVMYPALAFSTREDIVKLYMDAPVTALAEAAKSPKDRRVSVVGTVVSARYFYLLVSV